MEKDRTEIKEKIGVPPHKKRVFPFVGPTCLPFCHSCPVIPMCFSIYVSVFSYFFFFSCLSYFFLIFARFFGISCFVVFFAIFRPEGRKKGNK